MLTPIHFLIIGIVILVFLIFYKFGYTQLTYVKSKIDDDYHLVRNYDDKQEAADLMAKIKNRIEKLIKYLKQEYPNDERVKLFKKRFDEDNIEETDVRDSGTSYSIDKGETVSLCLRNKTSDKPLHDINLLMFVTIHEMAHIMAKSYGHNDEFGSLFVFLLQNAVRAGVYRNEDYEKNPKQFCGMEVDSNPIA
jgi:predicted metal-dependent hydrolase